MGQKDESYYIERILDGETEYFSVFLDRYSRPLYTLVVQIVGCPEDAEELLQDIFLKAFRNLNRYKGECRFSTWIYRIAYNAAISATRKKKQEFLYIEENTINNVPDEMADNVLAPAETEEQLERLEMAIDQLSGEEKAVIISDNCPVRGVKGEQGFSAISAFCPSFERKTKKYGNDTRKQEPPPVRDGGMCDSCFCKYQQQEQDM